MKSLVIAFSAITLLAFTLAGGLTKEEREMAAAELNQSKERLMSAIEGLNEEQLDFKIDDNSWSIAECVEHLAISEISFAEMLQGMLKAPADPSKRADVKVSDKELIAMLVDQTNKVKTQQPFEPTGKFGSHEATVEKFLEKRAAAIDFVKSTKEDLRNRVQEFPFGSVDGFQVLLFTSAHTERHVRQIEEIMADIDFPED
ncbi:MAG: DinB family protein [Flavobacteriaceae bacterium]|nr:DinB family protein [Flavobacteriaceae bacterium]